MKENQQHSLKSTQRLLWGLITAPEGVEKALKDFRKKTLPIRGDDRLSNRERLDIYANMYFFRIRDSLKEDFSAVLKLIGEARFHNLITDYLLKFPPTHWSLRYAGQHLPKFLKSHPFIKKWPFLSDLARMEWGLITSFDASDAQVLTKAELSSVPPGRWGELRLKLVPSCRLSTFRWKVDLIREQILKRRLLGIPQSRATDLIVWRHDLKVFYRAVESLEHKLLKSILRKATLAELCEVVLKSEGNEEAVSRVTGYLDHWIKDGLLA